MGTDVAESDSPKPGYLYILVHRDLPYLAKVGRTDRDPVDRLKEHNSNSKAFLGQIVERTGRAFEILTYVPVTDAVKGEAYLWEAIRKERGLELINNPDLGYIRQHLMANPYLDMDRKPSLKGRFRLDSKEYQDFYRSVLAEWGRPGLEDKAAHLIDELKAKQKANDNRGRRSRLWHRPPPLEYTEDDIRELLEHFDKGYGVIQRIEGVIKAVRDHCYKAIHFRYGREACENCGSTSEVSLRNYREIPTIGMIIYQMVESNIGEFEEFKSNRRPEFELRLPDKKVPVCPKCGSSRIRHRIRKNNYICEKNRSGRICKFEFADPAKGYDEKAVQKAEKVLAAEMKRLFARENGYEKEAVHFCLQEVLGYIETPPKKLCNHCGGK